jgi:2-haloacid dehalogenase
MAQDRWMTFDCFGTLIDWTSGFRFILKPLAGDRTDALMAEYHRAERVLEAEKPHRRYRDVLTQGMRQAAEAIGLDLAAADADSLVRRWGDLPLYPDVPAAFAALRDAGWKIAMLTNCDDDLFAATAARNPPLAPDLVVTAEQVGSYKPAFGHFALRGAHRRQAAELGARRLQLAPRHRAGAALWHRASLGRPRPNRGGPGCGLARGP